MEIRGKTGLAVALLAGALAAAAPAALCRPQDQKPPDQNAQKPAEQSASKPADAPRDQQAQPEQDSLAEAARKARANKPKTDTKKVYTTDDLKSSGGGGVSVVGEKDSGTSEGDAANKALGRAGMATGGNASGGALTAGAGGGAKGESYWRQRSQALRDQMAQVDAEIAKLQDEIKKGGSAGFNVQSGLKDDTVYFEDRNAKMKRLEQKKADIQKQIDALEDEARRADVPSGWIH